MPSTALLAQYMESLLAGNRKRCREFMQQQLENQRDVTQIYGKLLWPSMEEVDRLFRADRINTATEHMATRINRCIADQLQLHLHRMPTNGKKVIITCADHEPEELGAQMSADLFESRGWQVTFLGGGVPNDEILNLVGTLRPDVLLIFGTEPTGVPQVRALVDMIRGVSACPTMNIMISGGVFNRAEGLWKEVHADLFASNAAEAIPLAERAKPREAQIVIPGAPKHRRRRRRPPVLAMAAAN
jgi:methanogenic corrinoid protein MtbC1